MAVLEDKVVLVTGVAKGCGRVLAEAFAAEGAKLVGCDIDLDGGHATTAAVRAAGGEMTFVEADVADDTAVRDLVATAVQTYGGLDCAVNNAGTEATGLIADATDAVFDQLIGVNLKGLLSCLRHEIAAMRARGGGSIVNMSSVTSDITAVAANGLYAATKGGVNALTKAAAIEVAKDNISVNSLAFAAIDIPGDMILAIPRQPGHRARPTRRHVPHRPNGAARRTGGGGALPLLRRRALRDRHNARPRRRIHGAIEEPWRTTGWTKAQLAIPKRSKRTPPWALPR